MDSRFLQDAYRAVEKHYGDENFCVTSLCQELGLSRMHLHRKLKSFGAPPPGRFIRRVRLKKARELILDSEHSIGEISFLAGFRSESHFIYVFKNYYGYTPGTLRSQ